jgi:hypothetical protein
VRAVVRSGLCACGCAFGTLVIEFGTRLCDHDQRKWTSIFKSYTLFLVCVFFHVTVFVSISISPCQTFLQLSLSRRIQKQLYLCLQPWTRCSISCAALLFQHGTVRLTRRAMTGAPAAQFQILLRVGVFVLHRTVHTAYSAKPPLHLLITMQISNDLLFSPLTT